MKTCMLLMVAVVAMGITMGSSLACNHDIECPAAWVWSDEEGTCVEAESGTS